MTAEDNSWKEKYQQLKAEYDEFAYLVSHDLKAPLRAINNLTGWIAEDLGETLDADVQHNLTLLQNRAERMEGMISAILQFSRIERTDLQISEVDPEALVQEWAAQILTDKPVALRTAGLPKFRTYGNKLKTVLHQLLQNALDFSQGAKAEISISCTKEMDHYVFTVADQGIGVPADALDKVFKMFYTVRPKDLAIQLGTGLTIAKRIVQFVGGTISLQSEIGKGTTVTFTWPLEAPLPKTDQ